ncbi:hypothetical protein OH76DRAFT_1401054 [Lentinus brumalis]|uniref:Uncharacterized protein n=1 Tax=Lentinus brumalis TaxID=2498619 RepID=A0A371DGI0_9APHY|nr:hypothetical protein OH76DRAFT_1401054 [Polyporus brumalis]
MAHMVSSFYTTRHASWLLPLAASVPRRRSALPTTPSARPSSSPESLPSSSSCLDAATMRSQLPAARKTLSGDSPLRNPLPPSNTDSRVSAALHGCTAASIRSYAHHPNLPHAVPAHLLITHRPRGGCNCATGRQYHGHRRLVM